MMRLAGKTALITGAARGIGLAFAERFVSEGARVVIGDVDMDRARGVAKGMGAWAVEMDVTDQQSIDRAVADAVGTLGQIDILVNNAAVFTAAPISDITRSEYARAFDVNVAGTLFTLQAVARHMIDRGIKGKIINMASQAGRRGEPLVAIYCATKAAVISLTQSAGLNLISHGINVNAISPGVVDGEHWDAVDGYFARLE
ncbi:MAG: SDR family NAD(P)-dependent oxidoreductase, partial [Pseudomonadota bacterium]